MPLDDLTEEQNSLFSDGPQKHNWNLDTEKRQILDVLGARGHLVWRTYSTNRRRVKRLSPSRPEP